MRGSAAHVSDEARGKMGFPGFDLVMAVGAKESALRQLGPQGLKTPIVSASNVKALTCRLNVMESQCMDTAAVAANSAAATTQLDHPTFQLVTFSWLGAV